MDRSFSNKNDDDDDDDDKYQVHYDSTATHMAKRPRLLRTENTPVSSSSSTSTYGRERMPSPPIASDGGRRIDAAGHDVLAVGIRQNQSIVQDDRFTEYQREDGLNGPAQGAKGSKDAFNIDYLTEYKRRIDMLQENPDFAFAFKVLGFLNGDVFEIIDEDTFRRGIERDIARAKEEARKQLSRAETLNELRRESAEREKQLKLVTAEIKMLQNKSKLWQDARTRFNNDSKIAAQYLANNDKITAASLTGPQLRNALADRGLVNDSQKLFDLMARSAFIRYGKAGLLNKGFASDMERLFRRFVGSQINEGKFAAVKDLMPQLSDVALYMAALKGLSNSRGVLNEVVKAIPFPPSSEYSKQPELFAADAAALTSMVMPDNGVAGQAVGPVTFKQISLLLYGHINNMITRFGLPESEKIAKPSQISDRTASTQSGRRTKKIYGQEVDVNVDDALLGRAALGEKNIFTEEQLLAYRQTLFTNNEWNKTLTNVQRILFPLFVEGFGKLFFVDVPKDTEEYDRVYNESRYPIEDESLVRSPFSEYRSNAGGSETSVAEIFSVAIFLIASSNENVPYNSLGYDKKYFQVDLEVLFDFFFEANGAVQNDWKRYEENLRNSVVKRVLGASIAKLLFLMHDKLSLPDGTPIIFSESDLKLLDDYLKLSADASINEKRKINDELLEMFDNRDPFSKELANKTSLESIYSSPSNRSFKVIIDKYKTDPVFPVPRELERTKNELTQSLEIYSKKINDALTKTPQQVNEEIVANLSLASTDVSRQWAMQPFNSGFMKPSWRFLSCLDDATKLVRRECPNLNWIRDDEDLQRNPLTITDFAHLVANKILIVNATNPGEYLRDKTIPDLKILVVDNINALRRIKPRSSCSTGFGTPSYSAGAASSYRALPLKQKYSQFFS